ncbi:monocarboxylate transporter 12-like [Ischnura elegans]|uniref:monocarboxylate transporter 12-like n=1 Tax=Ischnura elegans TaxID=197161 RepID=UPI001ED8A561|nr:monocarboxylate transporter 12-like [Ischnura elegans]XP_046400972.1 monocarboxylate transporter 12-like [Ischnura elegans]
MDWKGRDYVVANSIRTRWDGTHGGPSCPKDTEPVGPEADDIGPEFAHVPGFSYSVSGEGKAWVEYTEKEAKKLAKKTKGTSTSTPGKPKGQPRAPDGGWGWVVVVASLGISLVADGISFSFGILYIEFLRHFRESKSKTSVIGSLFMSVPLMAGPVASALVDRYGCRSMTILGGVISALGFVISSRVDSIEVMCFTFGILSGLGLALCYVTAVVCVAYWFDRKRSLANGLGVCGTGVGTFVFAPLTQALIETYGWRGTTLILGGAFLQMCVCGAVMREPDFVEADVAEVALKEIEEGGGGITSPGRQRGLPGIAETTTFSLEVSKAGIKGKGAVIRSLNDLVNDGDVKGIIKSCTAEGGGCLQPPADESIPFASSSYRTLDISEEQDVSCEPSKAEVPQIKEATQVSPVENPEEPAGLESKNSVALKQIMPSSNMHKEPNNQQLTKVGSKSTPPPAPHQNSAMDQLQGLRFRRNSISCRGTLPMNLPPKHDPRVSSCPDIYGIGSPHSTKQNKKKWCSNFLHVLSDLMDFSMFLEWHFMLLSFSTFLLFTFFIVPYFYLAEHMISLGYSESEASILISIIGILNTMGMIALGWAGDQAWMNVTKTYALCLCLCGICTGIMPLLTNSYLLLAIDCALFGLFFASNFSFTPVLIVELISLDRFTMAYGMILLTQGLGNLVGPPLAGWFYDITNTWNLSFYIAGFFIFISGLAIALITSTNNFIVGKSKPKMANESNPNDDEGVSCKHTLLEAG